MSIIAYFRPQSKAALLRGERVHWIENNARAAYIRKCVLSFPPWVDRNALRAVWQTCRDLERVTGVAHHISHIVPLNHPRVSGLTVPWNLKALPAKKNMSDGNAWCEWHGDLFSEPEQLRLL